MDLLKKRNELIWHPESPGVRVEVTRTWIGRLFKDKKFATLGEVLRAYKETPMTIKEKIIQIILVILANPFITGGIAGRVKDDWDEDCKYGFYWWFWLPSIDCNGGVLKQGDTVDINIHWLCFWFAITAWPSRFTNRIINHG